MMRCGTCYQEFTAVDFVSLRNLCEHVYLDSLAQKRKSSLAGPVMYSQSLAVSQPECSRDVMHSESLGELVSLEQ
jgi:hypothetical protein